MSPPSLSLKKGDKGQLSAVVTANDPSVAKTVTWASANAAVATVDANGLVTAVASGNTTVTATSTADANFKASAQISVTDQGSGILRVNVDPRAVTLATGQTIAIAATVDIDPNVQPRPSANVTYASSDATVATVSAAGVVTAVKAGTATIKVTSTADANVFANVAVTVRDPVPASISILSITFGALNTPVNVTNTFGQIDVSINVQPNDEKVLSVDLLVDNKKVTSQVFSAAQVAAMLERSAFKAAGEEPAVGSAAASASDVIVLSFRTDSFIPATGAVGFLNGHHKVGAVGNVQTATSTTKRASNEQTLVFNNNDGFYATMDNAPKNAGLKSAISNAGLEWRQGDVVLTTVPVVYTPTTPDGTTAEQVCIRTIGFGGAPLPPAIGTSTACVGGPNTTTIVIPQGAVGYQSPGPAPETPFVNAATYADGSQMVFNQNPAAPQSTGGLINVGVQPAAGVMLIGFRIDNLAPAFTAAATTSGSVGAPALTRSAPAVSGWVNAGFSFKPTSFLNSINDGTGVGLRPTRDTKFQFQGCPFVTKPGGAVADTRTWTDFDGTGATVPECATDFTGGVPAGPQGPYSTRVLESDRLNNNFLTTERWPETGRYGVDKTAPRQRFAGVGTGPTQLTNAAIDSQVVAISGPGGVTNPVFRSEALDERSGFLNPGALAHAMSRANSTLPTGFCQISAVAPNNVPGATFVSNPTCTLTTTGAVIGAALADGYRPGPVIDPIVLTTLGADIGAGYFTYKAQWTDQAGNVAVVDQNGAATPQILHVVNDPAAPTVANLNVPVSINSTTYPAFTSTVSDDVEDIGQNHAVFYPVVGWLRYPRTNANMTFDDLISAPTTITTVSPFPASTPSFVRRVEIVDGTSAVQSAATTDPTAKPTSAQTVVFDVFGQSAASPPTAIPAVVVQNGVAFATFNAANPTVSFTAWKMLGLSAGFFAPAGLKAQVTAPLNSINAPFARVDFYAQDVSGDYWYLGSTTAAINADNGVNRFWTYVAPATLVNSPLLPTAQGTPAAGATVLAVGVTAAGDGISTLATILAP